MLTAQDVQDMVRLSPEVVSLSHEKKNEFIAYLIWKHKKMGDQLFHLKFALILLVTVCMGYVL